jgi:hypothetical protein
MALGTKTKVGKEKGDIVKAVGTITLQELKGSVLSDADTIYSTEIVGFFTGLVKTIQGDRYDEVILAGTIKSDGSPDFGRPKYYYLEGMPVSFLPNPDYDYSSGSEVASTPNKSFDWLGAINSAINTVGGILGLIKKKDKTVSDADSDSTTVSTDAKSEEQSWLQKNMIYVISFVGIVLTGGVIVYFFNRSEKNKAQANKQLT